MKDQEPSDLETYEEMAIVNNGDRDPVLKLPPDEPSCKILGYRSGTIHSANS